MIMYAVRSKRQRDARNGQFFMSRKLERAVTEAVIAAKKQRRRFYVVVLVSNA